jgi:tetratricopeptide (TPR) repeat protein
MNAQGTPQATQLQQLQQQLNRRASAPTSSQSASEVGGAQHGASQRTLGSGARKDAGSYMDNMIELYSIRDVARIFALQESRLRYWMQTGFVGPTVRKGGRFYYRFADIIAVKAAKDLLAAGLPLQKVRKNLDALKRALPPDANAAVKLRICSDGETIVALDEDVAFVPTSGQIVMAFTVPTLSARVAEVLSLPSGSLDLETESAQVISDDPVPEMTGVETTDANGNSAAYRCFLDGCAAEAAGEASTAEHLFRQAMELEPSMAAAMTNLGNMMHRQSNLSEARTLYERALEFEPYQAEARYNFANVLEDLGEIDLAINQLRQVCVMNPDFADAHYNLGVLLARMGGTVQAQTHLQRYLELDPQSEWSTHARDYLAELAA